MLLWKSESLLEVMQTPTGPVVVGRCGAAEFGVGDVFTELRWHRSERRENPLRYETVEAGMAAEVEIRVVEIGFYGRRIERLCPGCSAGLNVDGNGMPVLLGIDYTADRLGGRWWSLRGRRLSGIA